MNRKLDAQTLKSFTHPLRLKIYELLEDRGPQTATTLAVELGENTGATSYHLRELAKHGMIEIAEGVGKGKEKYWRVTPGGFMTGPPWEEKDPAAAAGAEVMLDSTLRRRGEELARWREEGASTPQEWIEASVLAHRVFRLTAPQMGEMTREVLAVLERYRLMSEDHVQRPAEGTERVVVHFDTFPVGVSAAPPA
ncbi:ArsR/SmtB family transcription factor [Nonomuraea sp. NPDC050663]|uniref:ArsR/SmtB family transcription factor n=1 Tax=Nonomuraea sp. NPDC050663 TaxID=3364370 RepID=UPI0037B76311